MELRHMCLGMCSTWPLVSSSRPTTVERTVEGQSVWLYHPGMFVSSGFYFWRLK